MVWNDKKIADWASSGGVTPFDETLVNPASLDLRLGNTIREPHKLWNTLSEIDMRHHIEKGTIDELPKWGDAKEFHTHWLFPGRFVLCHSLEKVRIGVMSACLLVLKSKLGRLGVNHSHSGWGDPGFGLPKNNSSDDGAQWTLEIQNISPWPVKLVAGERLIQQVFFDMTEAPRVDYRDTGHYVYQTGPTPAMV